MAITKIGSLLLKEASMYKEALSKWKELYSNLSTNAQKMLSSGKNRVAKSYTEYANGINRGTNNIYRKKGVTKVNIDNVSDNQIREAIVNLSEYRQKLLDAGDTTGARMAELALSRLHSTKAVDFLKKSKGALGYDPRFRVARVKNLPDAVSNMPDKVQKEFLDGRDKLYNAFIRRHEANEMLFSDDNIRRVMLGNKTGYDYIKSTTIKNGRFL